MLSFVGSRATTHTDLQLRARDLGIKVHVIHNASIINAIGVCGLQLYRFGEVSAFMTPSSCQCDSQVVSIVFFTPTWRPDSFYDKIAANRSRGLHTLCLLDIKVKELSEDALCRGKQIYEPPRYMTINTVPLSAKKIHQTLCFRPWRNCLKSWPAKKTKHTMQTRAASASPASVRQINRFASGRCSSSQLLISVRRCTV